MGRGARVAVLTRTDCGARPLLRGRSVPAARRHGTARAAGLHQLQRAPARLLLLV